MVRSIGPNSAQKIASGQEQQAASPPTAFQAQPFLLSQSGAVHPAGEWPNYQPLLPPGLQGQIEKMEVMALDPAGVHAKNEFQIDDSGVVEARAGTRPLGHNPYQISLIAKDGSRYSAQVDISPRRTGVSHQGYDTVTGLRFERERPALPEEIELAPFLLSQSGTALPTGDWPHHTPLLPAGLAGEFARLEVMALDPAGVHAQNAFEIDDSGVLQGRPGGRPLGHNPYQVTLVAADGTRFSGRVDISPRATGVSHQGYDTIQGLKLVREREQVQPSEQGMEGVARDFARGQGARDDAPSLERSPAGVFFQHKLGKE